MIYEAHMWLHVGYSAKVEADSEEEAERILQEIFDNVEFSDLAYCDSGFEITDSYEAVN